MGWWESSWYVEWICWTWNQRFRLVRKWVSTEQLDSPLDIGSGGGNGVVVLSSIHSKHLQELPNKVTTLLEAMKISEEGQFDSIKANSFTLPKSTQGDWAPIGYFRWGGFSCVKPNYDARGCVQVCVSLCPHLSNVKNVPSVSGNLCNFLKYSIQIKTSLSSSLFFQHFMPLFMSPNKRNTMNVFKTRSSETEHCYPHLNNYPMLCCLLKYWSFPPLLFLLTLTISSDIVLLQVSDLTGERKLFIHNVLK